MINPQPNSKNSTLHVCFSYTFLTNLNYSVINIENLQEIYAKLLFDYSQCILVWINRN